MSMTLSSYVRIQVSPSYTHVNLASLDSIVVIDSVTRRLRQHASCSQLNGSSRRRPAHLIASHPVSRRRRQLHLPLRDVTHVIAEHDADWLRPALTGRHCFSNRPTPATAVSIIHTALAGQWASLLAISHCRPDSIASIKRASRLPSFRMRTSPNLC